MFFSVPSAHIVTTINVTNVATEFTVLGAPGATLRYRIIYLKVSLNRSAAAGGFEGDLLLATGGVALWHWTLQQPNQWESFANFAFPGILLDLNAAIIINAVGTIAGPTAHRVTCHYYTDTAT